MKYTGCVQGKDAEISLEREGMRLGDRFLDFADVASLRPIDHRVHVRTLDGEAIEVSMLGFSFDGFWEELNGLFGDRCMEALFADEQPLMVAEGEYEAPREKGRAKLILLPDAVCILPPTTGAVRVPLCFTEELRLDGYLLHLATASGDRYTVGRMGYDTKPFAERARAAADAVKKARAAAIKPFALLEPFTVKGLFRTAQPEHHWQAAFGEGVCAVELFTDEDAATYLYRFSESGATFQRRLEEAMEAVGSNREIIYRSEAQIAEKPLWRMAVRLSPSVAFLRARSDGRLIHTENHDKRLREYLA